MPPASAARSSVVDSCVRAARRAAAPARTNKQGVVEMNSKARWAWGLAVAMLATAAFAQDAGDEEDGRPKRATKIPTEGFWPTQKMMDRVVDRITDEMAGHYQFDDDQLDSRSS